MDKNLKPGTTLSALEYADVHENVVIRIAGNGYPAGTDIAWIPPETEFPFDLEEVEGEVQADGSFEATNLNDGNGARGWRFHDWNANTIYSIRLRVDPEVWQAEYENLYGDAAD